MKGYLYLNKESAPNICRAHSARRKAAHTQQATATSLLGSIILLLVRELISILHTRASRAAFTTRAPHMLWHLSNFGDLDTNHAQRRGRHC